MYNAYRQFAVSRKSVHPGGGVMIFFSPKYAVTQFHARVSSPPSCEVLSVVDTSDSHCWVLVYCPPDCSAADTDMLCECLDSLLANYINVTILGDLNMPDVNWQQIDIKADRSAQHHFLLLCDSLSQIVNQPTRADNWLDLILMTCP